MPEDFIKASRFLFRIKKKLQGKGVSESLIKAVFRRLKELNLLDDMSYASRRAYLLATRLYGDLYIRYHLIQEGIPEDMTDKAVSSIPPEYSEESRILALKNKMPPGKKDIIRYLSNRGFTFDNIYRIAGYNS